MTLKLISIFTACLLGLAVTACVKEQASQPPLPATQQVEPEPSQEPDPRTLASLQLTEIHLKDNNQWMERVIRQANQIAESEK